MVSLNSSIKTPFYAANQTIIKNSQIPFRGNSQESETEEKKPPVLLISLAAAAAILAAGAGHKTYSVKNALKEANLKENNISLTGIFGRNLNPVNWFKKEDAIKSLTDIECTKIGDSNILFKTKDGDVVLLDRSKVFDVKKGDGENVEEFVEKMKKSSTKTDDISTKTDSVPTKLPEGINPETIKAIKALPQEATEENANKLTSILLKDMGFDLEKLPLKVCYVEPEKLPNATMGQFNIKTGELLLTNKILGNLNISQLAPVLRHELSHFEKMAKSCKQLGLDEYGKFTTSIPDFAVKGDFNKDFWSKVIDNTIVEEGFSHKPYTEGVIKQIESINLDGSAYSNYQNIYNYYQNPFEQIAYKTQHDFETALDTKIADTYEPIVEAFSKVDKKLDGFLDKKYPEFKNFKPQIFNYLEKEACKDELTVFENLSPLQEKAKFIEHIIDKMDSMPITKEIIEQESLATIQNFYQILKQNPNQRQKGLQSLNKSIDECLTIKNLSPKIEVELLAKKIILGNNDLLNNGFENYKVLKNGDFETPINIPDDIRKRFLSNLTTELNDLSSIYDLLPAKYNENTAIIRKLMNYYSY